MLSLRQEVGSNKLSIGSVICQHTHLAGTSRHVDSHLVEAYLLLGSHHILIARTEYLEYLGHALSTVGHCADSLYATSLEYLADACNAGSHKNGGIHLAFTIRRCAEHNLPATGNLGWRGQHQHSREEGGSAAWDIETYALDGYALLPTANARLRLHLLALKLLGCMKLMDVLVGQFDGGLQFWAYQLLSLLHLLLAHGQLLQRSFVELQFILLDGLVATLAHIAQHRAHRLVQFGQVQTWARRNLTP